MDVFEFIAEKRRSGVGVALATVVQTRGSSPAEPGAKLALAADGTQTGTVGGGELEAKVIEEARAALAGKKPRLLVFRMDAPRAGEQGMLCGGEQEVFIDVLAASHHLLIFGGGHVGLALARLAEAIGFPFSVADDREQFVSRDRFPRARQLCRVDFANLPPELPIDEDTFIVILTRGHQYDQVCLEKALATPARYLGMIGSARKVEKIFSALEEKGLSPRTDPRVHAPMGLDLGDNSPEEIAVSILAEIIKIKSGGSGASLREVKRKSAEKR